MTMTDMPTYHRGQRNFGTGYDMMDRIEKLEAKLERIPEEWAMAVYGDLENGVASLNAAAATDFCERYPSISSFGDTLQDILLEQLT